MLQESGRYREKKIYREQRKRAKREINADSRQHERGRERERDRDYGYFSFAASSQTNKPIVKSQPGN